MEHVKIDMRKGKEKIHKPVMLAILDAAIRLITDKDIEFFEIKVGVKETNSEEGK